MSETNTVSPLRQRMIEDIAPRVANGAFAASFALSMVFSSHPDDWCDPQIQAQRRAEIEKQQRENAAYHERVANEQEERLNREERERFAAQAHK
jgi:hypothetical protein